MKFDVSSWMYRETEQVHCGKRSLALSPVYLLTFKHHFSLHIKAKMHNKVDII